MSTQKKPRRRKYRTNCNAKNLKQLCVRLDENIHSLIEIHSYDENGRKLSKAKVLEDMISFAAPRMLKARSL